MKFAANLLLLRWERAKKIEEIAEETLNRLLPESVSDGYVLVQAWISEEKRSYECSTPVLSECYPIV